MKLAVSLSAGVVRIGLSKDLHELLNEIYYIDIKRVHILKLARLFFRAIRLYEKVKDVDLWTFLFDSIAEDRLRDAFAKTNRIDGEILQAELNKRGQLAKDFAHYNKVAIKLAEDYPKEWEKQVLNRQVGKHKQHLERLKKFKRNIR